MSKLLQTLNAEVGRMVQKTLREKVTAKLADLSGLIKRVEALEKAVKGLVPEKKPTALEAAAAAVQEKPFRVTGKQIQKLRARLELTQHQLAALLDVTMFSVNHWEKGKTIPRKELRAKIAALRSMSRRELKAMLEAKGAVRSRRASKKAAAKKAVAKKAKAAAPAVPETPAAPAAPAQA